MSSKFSEKKSKLVQPGKQWIQVQIKKQYRRTPKNQTSCIEELRNFAPKPKSSKHKDWYVRSETLLWLYIIIVILLLQTYTYNILWNVCIFYTHAGKQFSMKNVCLIQDSDLVYHVENYLINWVVFYVLLSKTFGAYIFLLIKEGPQMSQ